MLEKKQIKTEIAAGITTFFTMVYIVVVNPSILSTEGTGMPFSGVMTATVLLCFLMTLLMGLYAKLPYAVGPGMGLNALFAFTIILRNQTPWPVALGIVFWAGVIFLFCSLTPIRELIANAIPLHLRLASTAGIGLFLTFIGFKNLGLVVSDPVTIVKIGTINETTVIALMGLGLMVFFLYKKSPFAFIFGMSFITGLLYLLGHLSLPKSLVSMPDFSSVFFKLDIWSAFNIAFLPSIITIFFTDLFDSLSTMMGCSELAGLKDKDGRPYNLRQGLLVDAMATTSASLFGTSAGTAFVESAAGIEAGGRTGLTSIVTACCFLPLFFLGPLAAMVPAYATAPVLILVGALMFKSIAQINFDKLEELFPAFLTISLIPLTFSITQGILWGIISHAALFLLTGRWRELKPAMYALSGLSAALLLVENLSAS